MKEKTRMRFKIQPFGWTIRPDGHSFSSLIKREKERTEKFSGIFLMIQREKRIHREEYLQCEDQVLNT